MQKEDTLYSLFATLSPQKRKWIYIGEREVTFAEKVNFRCLDLAVPITPHLSSLSLFQIVSPGVKENILMNE